jgi:hypothetical protein
MAKKNKPKNAPKKVAAKKGHESDQLSDEQLDDAAGGAVDAFIGSGTIGAGIPKLPGGGGNHNLRAR